MTQAQRAELVKSDLVKSVEKVQKILQLIIENEQEVYELDNSEVYDYLAKKSPETLKGFSKYRFIQLMTSF